MSDRALAKIAAATLRLADGVNLLQRIVLAGDVDLVVGRQANAVIEEFDLLRFRVREAMLRGVIEPPARTIAAKLGAPPASRKAAAKSEAKRKARA